MNITVTKNLDLDLHLRHEMVSGKIKVIIVITEPGFEVPEIVEEYRKHHPDTNFLRLDFYDMVPSAGDMKLPEGGFTKEMAAFVLQFTKTIQDPENTHILVSCFTGSYQSPAIAAGVLMCLYGDPKNPNALQRQGRNFMRASQAVGAPLGNLKNRHPNPYVLYVFDVLLVQEGYMCFAYYDLQHLMRAMPAHYSEWKAGDWAKYLRANEFEPPLPDISAEERQRNLVQGTIKIWNLP